VAQIDLWQLHRIDRKVPQEEQFDAVRTLLREGVIKYAGLSEVTVEEIKIAQQYFPVATVQNKYNLRSRGAEDVLKYCTDENIGFIPWYPLSNGELTKSGGPVDAVTKRHDATISQIALAWLLQRSPVMLPIPGTSNVRHLEENVASAAIVLSAEDLAVLDTVERQA
jgi:pyridoxine 4-dehydrogenase